MFLKAWSGFFSWVFDKNKATIYFKKKFWLLLLFDCMSMCSIYWFSFSNSISLSDKECF